MRTFTLFNSRKPPQGMTLTRSMTLGAKIRRFRTKSGLSQDDLAHHLDISQPTYGKIESDAKMPTFEQMLKISEILEINLKEFMPDGCNHLNIENNTGQANAGDSSQVTVHWCSSRLQPKWRKYWTLVCRC